MDVILPTARGAQALLTTRRNFRELEQGVYRLAQAVYIRSSEEVPRRCRLVLAGPKYKVLSVIVLLLLILAYAVTPARATSTRRHFGCLPANQAVGQSGRTDFVPKDCGACLGHSVPAGVIRWRCFVVRAGLGAGHPAERYGGVGFYIVL